MQQHWKVFIWIVLVTCLGAYVLWVDGFRILKTPNEFGDFLAGFAAIMSLPAILIIFYDGAKRDVEIKENRLREFGYRKIESLMHIHEHLNSQYDMQGEDLRYQLEEVLQLKNKNAKAWNGKQSVFVYLIVHYFSGEKTQKTIDKIKERGRTKFVCKNFYMQVQSFISSIEKFNENLDEENRIDIEIIKTHPVCKVAGHLSKLD